MVNFVAAVAYNFCLSLPTAFTQPRARFLADIYLIRGLGYDRRGHGPLSGGGADRAALVGPQSGRALHPVAHVQVALPLVLVLREGCKMNQLLGTLGVSIFHYLSRM